jgi:hypothetical protein
MYQLYLGDQMELLLVLLPNILNVLEHGMDSVLV